ncbi:MAG: outer membrane beta-barrel protein [Crocinitomix sp.]|nr:outer membrane beta-barrel protein [Crocinitomix sp.]
MKRVLTFIGAALIATMSFNNTAVAQVEQGNLIIDPYIGTPTRNIIWGSIISGVTSNSDFSTAGLPVSFGGRAEFMAADNFGIGVDVNYVMSGYQYSTSYFDTVTVATYDANYKYTANILRAMVRLNYHFVQTDVLDAYFGVGAGYRTVKRTGSYSWGGEERDDLSTSITLVPVAFRLALGARYYFTDNIGANVELGLLGGGPIQVGLSIKI